ncbi:MAG: hypothetical protein ACRDZY_11890, partial [Acidimicrobiales bacterium]
SALALAHFGLVEDPAAVLAEAGETLRSWAAVAEAAFAGGRDIASALAGAYGHELDGVDPARREQLETLNGFHSNAAGLRRWLETRRPSPAVEG